MANTQSLHALLDQTGWIHALARRLTADPHLADDLAQATWVDALEQEPDAGRPLRGWLATVMRNNLSKLRRGEQNRAARERGASREERQTSTLDVVEKAETHRNIVLAVLALDEPYRSTLLMRFFEQLPYAEIARRTGVTRAGVNSRVTRGLELLRQRLETTYGGDRRALYLALTPLAKLPTGVATTIFGVKLMNVVIGTTAATCLAAALSVGLSRGGRETLEPSTVLAPAGVAEPVGTGTGETRAPLPGEPAPAESHERVALLPQERRARKESDENVWRTELYHVRALPATVASLAVNARSGDIEVLASASGRLEILARVSARLDAVSNDQLTQIFEDHVDVTEEEGMLRIEDKHEGGRGWSVSFVVSVPGRLPLSANSGSGDIVVRHADGKVAVNTGSGDVTVDLPAARVQALGANTGSGDVVVDVFSIESDLGANTGSGDVTVRVAEASSPGKASLNSGSGDVHLIVPPNVVGAFDLETSGDAIVLPPSLGIQVQKAGGRLTARGSVGSGGSYKLRSGSGELRVELGNALPPRSR